MRSLAREAVFKYLYSKLFNPSDEGLFDILIKDLSDENKGFANELKNFVLQGMDIYTAKIEKLSTSFKIDRIHKTDMCALLIGMAEFDNYKKATPKVVIIDQAVNLSAKFSTENSPNFVNGILAKYTEE